jgi:O-antigen ligase
MFGSILSLLNSASPSDAAGPIARVFVLFGLFAPLAIAHSKAIQKNMLFLMGGIFVNCIITLLQASLFPGIADALSINPTRPDISDIGRFQGLTSHPNIIGLSAALAVLLAFGLFSFDAYRHIRGRLVLIMSVCAPAALLSGSRTVFVSLIPGMIVLAIFQKQRRRLLMRVLVALIVFWGGLTYVAPAVVSQFGERLDSTGSDFYSDYGRLWSAVYAVQEISQKPIIGWGIDHIDDAGLTLVPWTGELVGAHNTFLKYWNAMGLLGAIGFLTLFVVPVRQILRLLKKNPSKTSTEALVLALACYAFLFIVSNLGPFDYNRFLYIPLFAFGGYAANLRASLEVRLAADHGQSRKISGRVTPLTA